MPDPGSRLSPILGSLPGLVVGVAAYKLLFGVWRRWDSADLGRVFRRQPVDSGGFWFLLYVLGCALVSGIAVVAVRERSLEGLVALAPRLEDVFGWLVLGFFAWVIVYNAVDRLSARRTAREAKGDPVDVRDRLTRLVKRVGGGGSRIGSAIASLSVREASVPTPGPYAMGAMLCVAAGLLIEPLIGAWQITGAGLAALVFLLFTAILAFMLSVQSKAWLPWRLLGFAGLALGLRGCFVGMPGS